MRLIANRLLFVLALAMLLSQTAIAEHDIRCLDGEHDTICKVYGTHDHNCSEVAQQKIQSCSLAEITVKTFVQVSPVQSNTNSYLTRAPPSAV